MSLPVRPARFPRLRRLAVLGSLLLATALPAWSQSLADWQADLDLLARELPARHANFFHTTPKADFESAVARLRAALPDLDRDQIVVEFAKLVALARDGHSGLPLVPVPGFEERSGFATLPLQLYQFDAADGWRVIGADAAHQALIGQRLLAIGSTPIAQAVAAVQAVAPFDNEYGAADMVGHYLVLPQLLYGLGLSAEPRRTTLTFAADDGRPQVVTLEAVAGTRTPAWLTSFDGAPASGLDWRRADASATGPRPSWLGPAAAPYGFEHLPGTKTTYFQFALIRQRPDLDFRRFVAQLFEAIEANGSERLVIDLRLNRGGDSSIVQPLIHALIRSDRINQPGRLLVLTGRRTFSAAQILVAQLEEHTQARFIGEPTGSAPNHYGETTLLTLPRSRLSAIVAGLYWQNGDPRDRREFVPPHRVVPYTYADYAARRDPVLQAALDYREPPALRQALAPALAQVDTDPAAVARAFAAWQQQYFGANPWRGGSEKELNDLGYALLDEQPAQALAVFQLAVARFPRSANAHDSLGEAYAALDQRIPAIRHYARALHLKPGDGHAERQLAKLYRQR